MAHHAKDLALPVQDTINANDTSGRMGALEQVGGAVARERLHDATEAFELATRQEREIEAEYEVWKLLLEQMKEVDAAQGKQFGVSAGTDDRGTIPEPDAAAIPKRPA